MKMKLFKRSVWTLLTVFFTILFAIIVVAGQIAATYSMWVDKYFKVERYKLVAAENGNDQDTQYYVSDYAIRDANGNLVLKDYSGVKKQTYDKEKMFAHSYDVCERVDEEGSVLLWNKNNALPLEEGAKVSNFGVGNLWWKYHGGGSGFVDIGGEPTIKDALESRGFAVNNQMLTLIKTLRAGYGVNSEAAKEIPWEKLNSSALGSVEKVVASYNDAAIFTIQRYASEGRDMLANESDSQDGKLISFTKAECSVIEGLQQLKQSGKIKKIVLLINAANALSLNYIKDYDIDACLWVGYGGSASLDAVADLLAGNANPSGHLTDTWVYDAMSAPANQNFGNYTFTQSDGVPASTPGSGGTANDKYVVYQEGIYVGYRYYETRYEDCVIGGRNADSAAGALGDANGWNYGKEVAYPFGHGTSYTTFEYSDYSVKKSGKNYEVTMTVKNTGTVAGKEVMQVYLQKPYTDYDVQNKIEKSAVELVGFQKTKLLAPGESQPLTVTVPEYEFKSYDANNKKTYILESGDYYLSAGKNAHDALNNILAAKGYTKNDGMDSDGNKDLTYKTNYSKDDFETYSVSPFTGETVTNQFEDADVNKYEGTKGQDITYLSRSNWKDTYPSTVTLTCTSQKMISDMQYEREVENNPEDKMPEYGKVTSEYGHINLIQLKGLPYDSPLWDDLLNEMSFDEQANFVKRTSAGVPSIAAPNAGATDGPCGIKDGNNNEHTAFPCNPITASTFNGELVEELGRAFGMEIMNLWGTGLFGLGANIHRSAFCGRAWEYFSEDSFLTGAMDSVESKGLRSMGAILFTKHFALNDQETNRHGVTTWANEQSIREIYLKAFETGITDGNNNGLMTGFNRIGCTWTGLHKGLLREILITEWGFTGVTLTDTPVKEYMGSASNSVYAAGVIAGQGSWLGAVNENIDEFKTNATFCNALRELVHRSLYTRLYSNAMNGISSDTRVIYVQPGWEKAILAAEIISGIIMGACVLMTAVSWILWYRDEREVKQTTSN